MNETLSWQEQYWYNCLKNIIPLKRLKDAKEYDISCKINDMHVKDNHFCAVITDNTNTFHTELIFKKFTSNEKRILNTLKNNTIFKEDIENNLFHEKFNDKLFKENINLFPSSIININFKCDCQNNNIICKHKILLLYKLTFELKKHPLLLFELKGYPLSDKLYNTLKSDSSISTNTNKQDIVGIDGISDDNNTANVYMDKTDKNNKAVNIADDENKEMHNESEKDMLEYTTYIKDIDELFYNNTLNNVEISKHIYPESIPDLSKQTSLVINNQDFIDEDIGLFIEKLIKNLKSYTKGHIKNHILFTKYYNDFIYTPNQDKSQKHAYSFFNYKWGKVTTWRDFSININSNYSISGIDVGSNSIFKKYKSSKLIVGFLVEYNKLIERNYNKKLDFINQIYIYTLELIIKHAIVPELFKSNDKYKIRWIPSVYNPLISKLIIQLSINCPDNLITFNRKHITKTNQIITFISLIIEGIIKLYLDSIDIDEKDKLLSNPLHELFLCESKKIDEIQNIDKINDLISFKRDKKYDYDLYILIKQVDDVFKLEVNIEYNDEKTSIEKFLENTDDKKLINQINNDLEYINRMIPQTSQTLINTDDILLTSDDFLEFFDKSIPLLENMGMKIIIPKSLEKLWHPKLVLNINEKNNSNNYLSLEKILDFDWQVAIGDNNISASDFEKLTQKNKHLIKLADKYVIVDYNDVLNILKQINKLPDKLNSYDLVKSIMNGNIEDIPVNIDRKFKEKLFNNNIEKDIKLPEYLNADLRNYQVLGFNWLKQNYKLGFGSILADDMGLGKTIQVLTLIEYLKEEDMLDESKVLVIAPTGLLINWQMEIDKFTPQLKSHIYHGSNRVIPDNDYDVLITSYGIIRQDYEELNNIHWNLIVIDEAQNIKNPSTLQTKAVKSLKATNKIALTGTPIENNLSECWSIFDFVNYGYLGKLNEFRKTYLRKIEKEASMTSLYNLKTIIQPFILRRLKTDKDIIKDLPDKITNDLYCNLSTKQAVLYEETLNTYMENIEKLDSINRKGKILELINSLKQICNHPAQLTKSSKVKIADSGKMQLLINTLESILDSNEKVLIFTQYVHMGNIIKDTLEEIFDEEVLFLHGSLSKSKRDKLVSKFQDDEKCKIFILSLRAGGTGLNLTAATNVIHYDLWWNPAVENQATDRAYRIGQKDNVMVYRFITTGTFEEHINDMLDDKKELADMTLGSGGKFITEMDDESLRQILELRRRI